MVTKSYLPSYLCDSRDGTDSSDSSDRSDSSDSSESCDRSDKITLVTKTILHAKKTAFVKPNFLTKKLVHKKRVSPKIVFDQFFFY